MSDLRQQVLEQPDEKVQLQKATDVQLLQLVHQAIRSQIEGLIEQFNTAGALVQRIVEADQPKKTTNVETMGQNGDID